MQNTAPVHKITIIPRTKGALGYTMQVEENEQNLLSKEEAFQKSWCIQVVVVLKN